MNIRISDLLHVKGMGDAYYDWMGACTGPNANCAWSDPACVKQQDQIVAACEQEYITDPSSPHNLVGSTQVPSQMVVGSPTWLAEYYNTAVYNTSAPASSSTTPILSSSGGGGSTVTRIGTVTINAGGGYQVGKQWSIIINNATPGGLVSIHAYQNGKDLGSANMGTTDASGNWSKSGAFDASTLGNWAESIDVAGVHIGDLSFIVTQAPSQTVSQQTGGSQQSNTTNSTTSTPTTDQGSVAAIRGGVPSNFMEMFGDINVGGHSIPIMYLVLGGGAVMLYMMSQKR